MTKYSDIDYNWVKKFIRKHPKGVSVKDIERFSKEEGIKLGVRPRDEKPPGREKIYQIVKDYEKKDWNYEKGGGKGKHSVLISKKIDPLSGLGQAASEMTISIKLRTLDELYQRKDKKFLILDIIEFYRIRESVISYPVKVLYIDLRQSGEREVLFNRALDITKEAIKKIKRIETVQRKKNNRFDKTIENLEKIRRSNILEAQILGGTRYKSFLNPRNTIRSMYKIASK